MATAANTAGNFFDENGAYYGPDCEKDGSQFNGAYYTGNYESPFKTYLGKTDAEIKEKMDAMWEHYFKGDNNSKVFFDNGNEGYIKDINNNDVRSEGMSYGMMIAVQTGHKEEFDKLWKWAKNHMWHKGGDWDGYFAWQRNDSGMGGDDNCAPDGEMYFMMSLLFAANRWDDDQYRKDALYIMDKMWNNPSHKLFNQGNYAGQKRILTSGKRQSPLHVITFTSLLTRALACLPTTAPSMVSRSPILTTPTPPSTCTTPCVAL